MLSLTQKLIDDVLGNIKLCPLMLTFDVLPTVEKDKKIQFLEILGKKWKKCKKIATRA